MKKVPSLLFRLRLEPLMDQFIDRFTDQIRDQFTDHQFIDHQFIDQISSEGNGFAVLASVLCVCLGGNT